MTIHHTHAISAKDFAKPEGVVGRQLAQIMFETNELMITQAYQQMSLMTGDTLLEVGHASGKHIPELLLYFDKIHYVGIEHSHTMYNLCLQQHKSLGLPCQFVKVAPNSYHLPFNNEQFNGILNVNVIYFYSNIKRAFAEFWRVLKPSGVLCIGFKDIRTLLSSPLDLTAMTMFEPHTIRELLLDTGFENLRANSYYQPIEKYDGSIVEMCYHLVTCQKSEHLWQSNTWFLS